MSWTRTLLILFIGTLITCCGDGHEETLVTGFTLQTASVTEGDVSNSVNLMITTREGVGDFEADYAVTAETARFGDDIAEGSGTLTFQNGEANLNVELIGDDHLELTETFSVLIDFEEKKHALQVQILDDDDPGTISEDQNGLYTPDEYPSMGLLWSDEFDGSSLDEANWTFELGNGCDVGICGWGNNELEVYTDQPENVSVAEGFLTITARESGTNSYTSARIKTQDKVEPTFGRIDIRARLPKGQGIWPALWMLGANIEDVGWPSCGEIDVMELVGHKPAEVHGTIHYDQDGHRFTGSGIGLEEGDYSDKFHVFTLVWDRNHMRWFVDNKQFYEVQNKPSMNYPFNAPFFFIMNLAVGGNWPGDPDETTVFPQEMVVDYIRVFQ